MDVDLLWLDSLLPRLTRLFLSFMFFTFWYLYLKKAKLPWFACLLLLVSVEKFLELTGSSLNVIVVFANKGKMPVVLNDDVKEIMKAHGIKTETIIDKRHCLLTPESNLKFLADRFVTKSFVTKSSDGFSISFNIKSIGDILVDCADFLTITIMLPYLVLLLIVSFIAPRKVFKRYS